MLWSFVRDPMEWGCRGERLREEKSFLEEVASKLVLERQERKCLFECMPLVYHERDGKWG